MKNRLINVALIVFAILFGIFVFAGNNHPTQTTAVMGTSANNDPTQLPVDSPTDLPTNTPLPTELPTVVPTAANTQSNNYQNFGWYQHDGKSMQYVNGQWYDTPQQCQEGQEEQINGQWMVCQSSQYVPVPTSTPPKVIYYPVYYHSYCWAPPCF